MSLLFLTADELGSWTGGSTVASQECLALKEFADQSVRQRRDATLSSVKVLSRRELGSTLEEPWKWDEVALKRLDETATIPRLCHVYSGTFSKTIKWLKEQGTKVTWTIAAHDVAISKREHEKLGLPFPYLHLTEKALWKRYISGYAMADVIICPGLEPAGVVRRYGEEFLQKRIEIIPHGCHLPEEIKPLPKTFVVGYCGAICGGDKGVRYLLEAWKRLNYTDGSLLVIAGKDSVSPWTRHLLNTYGGGSVHLAGWQKDMSDFYNSISLFVCPAATEGFNLEVVESLAHGRSVLCSKNAGAADLTPEGWRVPACDVDALVDRIRMARNAVESSYSFDWQGSWKERAVDYTWEKVRGMYKSLWTEVLYGKE
jgi:glycosyltransferase involved in cell wall biosynthesis